MRISKLFNTETQIPLVIQTLANDASSADVLGDDVKQHLAAAKAYFDNPTAPPHDPDNAQYRGFALPILDAFSLITDPSSKKGKIANWQSGGAYNNPTAENLAWIIKIYAKKVAQSEKITSEDLSQIHDEIEYFSRAKATLRERGLKAKLGEYDTYDEFKAVIRPMIDKAKHEKSRAISDKIRAETTTLYNGPEGRIVVPHTTKASQFWGLGTKLCSFGYDDGENKFPMINKKSPCIIFVLKTSKLETDDPKIKSGKILITEGRIHSERDVTLPELPDYISDLHEAALKNSNKKIKEYIELFGTQTEKPFPMERELPKDRTFPDLNLSESERAIIEDLNPKTNYKELFSENPDLLTNKDCIIAIVSVDPWALTALPRDLKTDPDTTLTAIKQDGFMIHSVPEELFENLDFANGLLDIADETSDQYRIEILRHIHRIPAFFGHVTTDTSALRQRLDQFRSTSAPEPQSPAETEPA